MNSIANLKWKNVEIETTFKFHIYYNTYLQVSPTMKHNTSIAGIIKVHVGCTPTTIDNKYLMHYYWWPQLTILRSSIILIEFVELLQQDLH